MNKSFKIKLYPNKKQEESFNQTFGCVRFIFNQMLNEKITIYEKLKNDQKTLSKYRLIYDKELELIKHLELKNKFDDEAYNIFYEKIKDYNKDVKEMNICEDVRNTDLIRVNIEKANFESKLNEIYKNKEYNDEKTNKNIEHFCKK